VLEVAMRLGLPTGNVKPDQAGVQSWFVRSHAESVKYFASTKTVRRRTALPVAGIGSLVALSTKKARPSELIVGVVIECTQLTDSDLAPPHETSLILRTVNGIGRAIDMKLPDSERFEPGYCLYADELDESPASVLVPAGRCKLPCEIQVREADEMYTVRLDLRVERIAGFERLSFTKI
jgi:hypothetical protein